MQTHTTEQAFSTSKKLVSDYIELRIRIFKLRMVRTIAKAAGNLIWIFVWMFLGFLLAVFVGLTAGFWFSSITGSYTTGFAFAGLSILVIMLLLAAFRRKIFLNPIISKMVKAMDEHKTHTPSN